MSDGRSIPRPDPNAEPVISVVDGPAGPRARLHGVGDVWEVIATWRDNEHDIAATAGNCNATPVAIQAAVDYYRADPAEVDLFIARNRTESLPPEEAASAAARRRALTDSLVESSEQLQRELDISGMTFEEWRAEQWGDSDIEPYS